MSSASTPNTQESRGLGTVLTRQTFFAQEGSRVFARSTRKRAAPDSDDPQASSIIIELTGGDELNLQQEAYLSHLRSLLLDALVEYFNTSSVPLWVDKYSALVHTTLRSRDPEHIELVKTVILEAGREGAVAVIDALQRIPKDEPFMFLAAFQKHLDLWELRARELPGTLLYRSFASAEIQDVLQIEIMKRPEIFDRVALGIRAIVYCSLDATETAKLCTARQPQSWGGINSLMRRDSAQLALRSSLSRMIWSDISRLLPRSPGERSGNWIALYGSYLSKSARKKLECHSDFIQSIVDAFDDVLGLATPLLQAADICFHGVNTKVKPTKITTWAKAAFDFLGRVAAFSTRMPPTSPRPDWVQVAFHDSVTRALHYAAFERGLNAVALQESYKHLKTEASKVAHALPNSSWLKGTLWIAPRLGGRGIRLDSMEESTELAVGTDQTGYEQVLPGFPLLIDGDFVMGAAQQVSRWIILEVASRRVQVFPKATSFALTLRSEYKYTRNMLGLPPISLLRLNAFERDMDLSFHPYEKELIKASKSSLSSIRILRKTLWAPPDALTSQWPNIAGALENRLVADKALSRFAKNHKHSEAAWSLDISSCTLSFSGSSLILSVAQALVVLALETGVAEFKLLRKLPVPSSSLQYALEDLVMNDVVEWGTDEPTVGFTDADVFTLSLSAKLNKKRVFVPRFGENS